MNRRRITRYLYWVVVVAVFSLATLAYMIGGEKWYNASYYSAQLFFMNYAEPQSQNVLIYVSRVLCPIMTATGIFALLKNALHAMADSFASKMKTATAVYFDSEQMAELGKSFRHPILMGQKINRTARSQVLLLEKDEDNLRFYEQLKKRLKKERQIYIKLENMDPSLLKENDAVFFCLNEIIAREYWQTRNLQSRLVNGKLNIKIAVLGFGKLGQKILSYGLMNNIYSLDQQIHYHVWGDSLQYRNLLGNFDMMSGDTITFHNASWVEELDQLRDFDRIIVADEPNIETLQTLMQLNSRIEIDFYDPTGTEFENFYIADNIASFGALQSVLTEENVKTDKLFRDAKEINYDYCVQHDSSNTYTWTCPDLEKKIDEKWAEQDNFKKGLNTSAADYHKLRLLIVEAMGIDKHALSEQQLEMLAEMEHIRWCRYYFVHHWSYAVEDNREQRQRKLLTRYNELPEDFKVGNREMVLMLLKDRPA